MTLLDLPPDVPVGAAPPWAVWALPDGALFASATRYVHLRGPHSRALARALVSPAPLLDVARRAAAEARTPVSESLYALVAWGEAGLAAHVLPGHPCPPLDAPLDAPPLRDVQAGRRAVRLAAFSDAEADALLDRLHGGLTGHGPPLVLARSLADGCRADVLPAHDALVVVPVGGALAMGPWVPASDREAALALGLRAARTHSAEAVARRTGGTCLRPALVALDPVLWQQAQPWLGAPQRLRGRTRCVSAGPDRSRTVALYPVRAARSSPRPALLPDGGYRTVPPEATLRRLRPFVSALAGPVTVLRRARTADAALPFVLAAHALHHAPVDFEHLAGTQTWSGGKGASWAQATASALCEALERHAGVWRGDEPVRIGRHEDVPDALAPNALQHFSDAQFAQRAPSPDDDRLCALVPAPFDPRAAFRWAPVRSLLTGRTAHVPAAWAYYGLSDDAAAPFVVADSNGCAAGNTWEEAVLQGLLERIERDAVSVWWHHRLARPALSLDTLDGPFPDALRRAVHRLGRTLWALDLTHDLGVPVVAAVSRRDAERFGGPDHLLVGFGAHPDRGVAVLRALSELAQAFPHDAQRPRRPHHVPTPPDWGHGAQRWFATATLATEPYLAPAATGARLAPPPRPFDGRIEDVLHALLQRLQDAGLDVLVLDQTRADVPLSVVRVVVPELRHFWRRLGPGRLYSVPEQLGWTRPGVQEADLNPWPMFA